jgi:hypothetical protein
VLGAIFYIVAVYTVMIFLGREQIDGTLRRADSWGPLTPAKSWRHDFVRGVKVATLAAAIGGVAIAGVAATDSSFAVAMMLGSGLAVAIGLATVLASTTAWQASLTFAQLSVTHGTPIRLLRFFEGARERNVLRTVGPVYQFRHARLQDRLAWEADNADLSSADMSTVQSASEARLTSA